jgi:hypothetical protein
VQKKAQTGLRTKAKQIAHQIKTCTTFSFKGVGTRALKRGGYTLAQRRFASACGRFNKFS